jgi:hypothetical protein
MEFNSNPPEFSVIFTDENPWQRRQVLEVLASLIAEDVFIIPSKNGDMLNTTLPASIQLADVEYCLCRAAQTPMPKEKKVPVDKIIINNQFL